MADRKPHVSSTDGLAVEKVLLLLLLFHEVASLRDQRKVNAF